jgi:ribonucleoside-diphosphate reductase alpha chain
VDHPDILEFISCKQDSRKLNNFNISVGLTESFIEAVHAGRHYPLINPRSGKETGALSARDVFDRIVFSAWENGEPGILFLDRINRDNPLPALGTIESTNPCGEQPLLSFESCNLGSLNLARLVCEGTLDWDRLAENVRVSVRFLDDVIDVNRYPLRQIAEATRGNRKIGLGVMGFADMLIRLGIPYDSPEALALAEKVMQRIADEAVRASEELAAERGPFPNFARSVFREQGRPPRRNATTTTIAPTGTISILAGCSSGIEPLFAVAFVRNVMDNDRFVEIHPLFEETARREGFFSGALMEKVLETGSVRGLEEVPEPWRRVFVTSHDISPERHIRMQAAFQQHTENSVSKTVNFPADASVEDVRTAFLLAHDLGCKGVTIYRDRSRDRQVLQAGSAGGTQGTAATAGRGAPSPALTPRPRPQTMRGVTRRMETSCGALYVTVNEDETGQPFEVFTSMGKAGGCAASQSEAIGRLVSLGLRSGVDPDQIIRQLRGISCHLPRGVGRNRVSSCADAVAQALQHVFHPVPESAMGPDPALPGVGPGGPAAAGGGGRAPDRLFLRGACPECQGTLEQEGGCSVCRDCGYSDCG